MNIPGFTAEDSLYRTKGQYHMVGVMVGSTDQVVPAIPPCRNCDFICDVCVRRGLACGACFYCYIGRCDPYEWSGGTYVGYR